MDNFLIGAAAVLVVAFVMAVGRNDGLNILGRGVLLLYVIAGVLGAIGCILFPIFSKSGDSGPLIFVTIPMLIVATVPWGLYKFARNLAKQRKMTPEKRAAAFKETMDEIDAKFGGRPSFIKTVAAAQFMADRQAKKEEAKKKDSVI